MYMYISIHMYKYMYTVTLAQVAYKGFSETRQTAIRMVVRTRHRLPR